MNELGLLFNFLLYTLKLCFKKIINAILDLKKKETVTDLCSISLI